MYLPSSMNNEHQNKKYRPTYRFRPGRCQKQILNIKTMSGVKCQRNNMRYGASFLIKSTLLFTVPYVRNQQE